MLDMNPIFKKDLYRYYGDEGESLAHRILRPIELRHLCLLRKAQASKSKIAKAIYEVRLRNLSKKSHIQIPIRTEIGEGFYM